ncbi:hypothetical protein [uncultured Imperialibacter sp.]|uniref:hypothetical protein n=1 Tax=uncultured Imperialibacter sp. TaxID=1672639 RepID=UPI0030D9A73A|tara:strand:+ start:2459 stop:2998 length:540 start_codon:yes stop_codon:yes gene_type:complete
MQKLYTSGDWSFFLSQSFHPRFLAPTEHYVQWKLTNDWDDYNELTHATRFFDEAQKKPTLEVDSHLLMKGGKLKGALFILRGELATIESRYPIPEPEKSLILKYFHIMERGQGIGQRWLKEVIIPYYGKLGFADIYLSSSHPKSFGFYEKFGKEIATYTSASDNGLLTREGKCFRVAIG